MIATTTIGADAKRWRALRALPRDLNASVFRMCMQAIGDGDGDLPGDPQVLLPVNLDDFVALARRAGIERGYSYRVYGRVRYPATGALAGIQDLYRHFDIADRLLYIGISGRLPVRETEHESGSRWWELIARSAAEPFETRLAVVTAERIAIQTEHPVFNRQYNNTPEARERMRAYLEGIGRMDLMWD